MTSENKFGFFTGETNREGKSVKQPRLTAGTEDERNKTVMILTEERE